MMKLLWFEIRLPAQLQFLGHELVSFPVNLLAWAIVALAIRVFLFRTLKWFTRKTRTEIDDVILDASRIPLWLIIIILGLAQSLGVFERRSMPMYLEKALHTALIAVTTYWAWRLFKDVLIYYGREIAERTETNVDDVLVPVANQLGPIVIFIVGGAMILQCWGVNLSTLLVAMGGGAFIAAFALQDTLSNMFGGIALLVDTPFKFGDLIVLEDGRVCVIERIGLRITQLYNTEDHSMIFMPNGQLANERLENITRPTPARRSVIRAKVGCDSDLQQVFDILHQAAHCHPHVLGDIHTKLQALRQCHIEPREAQIARLREEGHRNGDHIRSSLRELLRLEKEARRLQVEGELNTIIEQLTDELEGLANKVDELEEEGLVRGEKAEIAADIDEIERSIEEVRRGMTIWIMMRRYTMVESKGDLDTRAQISQQLQEYADRVAEGVAEGHIAILGTIPVSRREELEVSRQLDSIVNRHGFADLDRGFSDIDVREEFTRTVREWNKKAWLLGDKVRRIREELESGDEQRVDDLVREFRDWVYTGLKETTPEWKYPQVRIVGYGKSGWDLALDFYVDNIVLDHYERQENVEADLRREIWEGFRKAGIEMPCPQMDVHLRNQTSRLASHHAAALAPAAPAAPTPPA